MPHNAKNVHNDKPLVSYLKGDWFNEYIKFVLLSCWRSFCRHLSILIAVHVVKMHCLLN